MCGGSAVELHGGADDAAGAGGVQLGVPAGLPRTYVPSPPTGSMVQGTKHTPEGGHVFPRRRRPRVPLRSFAQFPVQPAVRLLDMQLAGERGV